MHCYEEYDELIQKLIKIMKDDYPNGFEMRINSFSAEIVNNQTVQTYLAEDRRNGDGGVNIGAVGEILRNMVGESNN